MKITCTRDVGVLEAHVVDSTKVPISGSQAEYLPVKDGRLHESLSPEPVLPSSIVTPHMYLLLRQEQIADCS